MSRAIVAICLFLTVAGMFAACPAWAQQEYIDLTEMKPVPDVSAELSEEDFVEQTELYQDTPLNDKFLAYEVRLPKLWHKATTADVGGSEKKIFTKDEDEEDETGLARKKKKRDEDSTSTILSASVLGLVAKYYGPGRIESPSKFEIEAQKLDYDVTAKNWFMQETLVRGYALEGLNVISDSRVEALYVVVEKDTAYVVRSVAEINGARMVVASYFVPDMFWPKERAHQQRAIESFRFLSPERSKIEATRTYAFLDLLTIEYPASWRLIAPSIFSIEGMEAKIIHTVDQKTVSGEINISIISTEFDSAIQDEIGFLKEELAKRELEIGDLIEKREGYEFKEQVFYGHVEVYKAIDFNKKLLEHEYWLAIMEEDRYFYVVSMLTPGRNSDFYAWARNAEAFETVIESFEN